MSDSVAPVNLIITYGLSQIMFLFGFGLRGGILAGMKKRLSWVPGVDVISLIPHGVPSFPL